MTNLWNKIKTWLLSALRTEANTEIDELNVWIPKLSALIAKNLDADTTAQTVVDYAKNELHSLVNKISDSNWLAKIFGIKNKMNAVIDSLDQYKGD
ncbi:MAG: hypothetical protein ACREA8_08890, partial [Nitrosotalea sp.]